MNEVCVFDQLVAFNSWLKTLKLKEKKDDIQCQIMVYIME